VGINVGYIFFAMPITYPAGFRASKIFGGVGGFAFFCAISALDTGVYCWGRSSYGQTGSSLGTLCSGNAGSVYLGTGAGGACYVPNKVNGPTNVVTDTTWNYNITDVAISGMSSAGTDYCQACALRGDGQVWCWGYNGYGNLGDGTTTNRPYALRVANLANIRAIFSQMYNSASMFALEDDNSTLWAWGYNGNYNLGIYQSDVMYAPVVVHGLRLSKNGY